jgi:hypothetical protein
LRSRIRTWITECPDDNTQLVERLTPENVIHDYSEARFVPLHKLGSPAEAEMVNDIFTNNDIRFGYQVRWRGRFLAATVGDC